MSAPQVVRDVMTARVATVRPDVKLGAVADAFEVHPFHHLPVVQETGKVVGIVSDRDLLRECLAGRYDPERSVASMMTSLVASIGPDAPIKDAAARLTKLGINSLIVIDEQSKLRGIITSRDLLRVVVGAS